MAGAVDDSTINIIVVIIIIIIIINIALLQTDWLRVGLPVNYPVTSKEGGPNNVTIVATTTITVQLNMLIQMLRLQLFLSRV